MNETFPTFSPQGLGAFVRSSGKTELLVQYLTGKLGPEEKLRLEEEYLGDQALFEELLAVQTELIDSYARGQLPSADARSLMRHFTPQEFRQRVVFSHALAREIRASQGRAESFFDRHHFFWTRALRFVPVAAVLVALILTVVWLTRRPAPVPQTARQSPPQVVQTVPKSAQIPVPALSLVLIPGQRSNEQANTVTLPLPGDRLRLELVLPRGGAYDAYSVTVRALGSPWSETIRDLKAQPRSSRERELVVELSMKDLHPDDYAASVSGQGKAGDEEFAGYTFRIIER